MSIKAKISLNIADVKAKLAEMSAKAKTTFQTISNKIKNEFSDKNLWGVLKKSFFKGGAAGIIQQGLASVTDWVSNYISHMFDKAFMRIEGYIQQFKQYDSLISRQQNKNQKNKSDLAVLESIQMKDTLTEEDKVRQSIALKHLKKTNYDIKPTFDSNGKIQNFGDFQRDIL